MRRDGYVAVKCTPDNMEEISQILEVNLLTAYDIAYSVYGSELELSSDEKLERRKAVEMIFKDLNRLYLVHPVRYEKYGGCSCGD